MQKEERVVKLLENELQFAVVSSCITRWRLFLFNKLGVTGVCFKSAGKHSDSLHSAVP